MKRMETRRFLRARACLIVIVVLALSFGGYRVIHYKLAVAMLKELGWLFVSEASSSRTADGSVVMLHPESCRCTAGSCDPA